MSVRLSFLGATGTVTGSRFLLETGAARVLVDCGLFQGRKEDRLRNRAPLPFDPRSLDAVLLTHAHVDHLGSVPRLCKEGYAGPVLLSSGSFDVAQFVLPDSGRLQEEDARLANRLGFSKHHPALPLYTEKDARAALRQFRRVGYRRPVEAAPGLRVEFLPAGHIVGSAHLRVEVDRGGGRPPLRLLFSGDVGAYDAPILPDPTPLPESDVVLVESTYGNRDHPAVDPRDTLAETIASTVARGGRVVMPAFAVGRTQEVLYLLHELMEANRIPAVPIYVDSPMAEQATRAVLGHSEDHDEEMRQRVRTGAPLAYQRATAVGPRRRSRAVVDGKRPAVVVSASGMATGGRVLLHLARLLPDPRHTVLLTGFQAAGTRGRRLAEGESEIKIHGQWVPVRARVAMIHGLSAHADRGQLLRWLGTAPRPPRRTFVVHGEPDAAAGLRDRIAADLGWSAEVPAYGDEAVLDE